jgi:hypothetical protein
MNKITTVSGVKIYPMEYLMNEELTEADLNNVFDTPSLLYSIIINMFHFAGYTSKRNTQIIKMIKEDKRWMYNNYWTHKQAKEYEDILTKVFMNVYCESEYRARSKAQWEMIWHGLHVKGNKIDLEK